MPNPFQNLPSVSQLLESPQLKKMVETANRNVVVDGVRTFLDDLRQQISSAAEEVSIPTAHELAERIANFLKIEDSSSLCPVVNGTGDVLHPGLGRAPLAATAINAIAAVSAGYASVEVDLESGQPGQRIEAVERSLRELTGAEAAVVVNNKTAAMMITLSAVAAGKQVLVSRGQLVEVDDNYRLTELVECSGAKLKEVGTTNQTQLADFELAIDENTGAILKVHPGNFQIVGVTESVSTEQLVALARKHAADELPVIDDIGSGALVDFSKYGLANEPLAADSIRAGADAVLFSGDKLLGGPQCGIIVGKRKWIKKILASPLMRAMQVDKMTLAALAATLRLYRDPELAEQHIPVLQMLSMPLENLQLRANKIATQIRHLPEIGACEVIEDRSMLDGVDLPTRTIPTWCLAIEAKSGSIETLVSQLRSATPAVISRVSENRLLLDLRTIFPSQDMELVTVFESFSA